MESITALVACGLAFALSYYIGRTWHRRRLSPP